MRFVVPRNEPYAQVRERLLLIICPGMTCFHCGTGGDPATLEFDHIGLRSYEASRLNSRQRLRTYYREWLAAGATVGQGLVGACAGCNQSLGGARSGGGVAKRSAYAKTPHRRRRRRKGAGYSTAAYITGMAEHYRALRAREVARLEDAPF